MDKSLEKLNELIDLAIKLKKKGKVEGSFETYIELIKVRIAINDESDRGAALFAVGLIDEYLKKTLSKKLIGNKNHKKKLFDFNGALGSLSNKIDMALSLGLITKNVYDDLGVIRKIRNEFAHSFECIDFDTKNISTLISTLKSNPNNLASSKTPRQNFLSTVNYICSLLSAIFLREKEIQLSTNIISDDFVQKIQNVDKEELLEDVKKQINEL